MNVFKVEHSVKQSYCAHEMNNHVDTPLQKICIRRERILFRTKAQQSKFTAKEIYSNMNETM